MTRLRTVTTLIALAAATTAYAQSPRAADLVKPQLLADTFAIQPGKPFRVGLLLRIAPNWHVYWKNPGDSGQSVSLSLDLPPGFKSSELQFPVPTKFLQPGDLVAYGYSNEVFLITTITPPAGESRAVPGPSSSITISAKLKYLVCEDTCLPGKADLSLSLPSSNSPSPANEDTFNEWTPQIPLTGEAASAIATVQPSSSANKHTLQVTWKTPADNIEFFPGKSPSLSIHDITVKNKPHHSSITFTADPLANQPTPTTPLEATIAYTDDRSIRRGIEVSVPLASEKSK